MKTLSDKRHDFRLIKKFMYEEEDVKEFIKELRKGFCLSEQINCKCSRCIFINELIGEKLK